LQDIENLTQKIEDNAIDTSIKEDIKSKIEKIEKKQLLQKKTLSTLENKYNGQILGNIIKDVEFDIIQQETAKVQLFSTTGNQVTAPKKSLLPQEEAIVKKVYGILRQNLIKATAEELIQKIEEVIRK
jgi:hypothetical protein